MSRTRRGPGINWELKYKHPAAELYEQGWTAHRIAYAFGSDVHSIRRELGDVIDEDAELQSERNLVRKARRALSAGKNFYDVRDACKVHADDLADLVSRDMGREGGDEDWAWDRMEADAHAYAVRLYTEYDKVLWDVAVALECGEEEAKRILDEDYDPYADYRRPEDTELGRKVIELRGKGFSWDRIDFFLRSYEVDSESLVGHGGRTSPTKKLLREEARRRLAEGERLPEIASDLGYAEYAVTGWLAGTYGHPLDLYGMDRGMRAEVERLYCDEGYDPDEVAAILGFEDRVVQRCVDEFLFTAKARGRHERSSELRWEKPDAERVTRPEEPEPSPDELLEVRERKSAETARWLGIDEAPARAFFEEGLLPPRSDLAKSMAARQGAARAMYAQSKTLGEISLALDVQEPTVKRYLHKELQAEAAAAAEAARRAEEERRIESGDHGDGLAALVISGVPRWTLSGEWGPTATESLNRYVRWKYPFAPYVSLWGCAARDLITNAGLSVAEAARELGMGRKQIKDAIGTFGADEGDPLTLGQHALAAYLVDCVGVDAGKAAELMGLEWADVQASLRDGRPESPYASGRGHWGFGYGPRMKAAEAAGMIGISEDLARQAVRTGVLDAPRQSWQTWYGDDWADALEVARMLGVFGRHPLPDVEVDDE